VGHIVEFRSTGGQVYVEVSDRSIEGGGPVKAGRVDGAPVSEAASTFEDALATVVTAANAFVGKTTSLARKPDELSVEFGLKMSGKVNAFVVSCDGEANFTVTMKWLSNDDHGT